MKRQARGTAGESLFPSLRPPRDGTATWARPPSVPLSAVKRTPGWPRFRFLPSRSQHFFFPLNFYAYTLYTCTGTHAHVNIHL